MGKSLHAQSKEATAELAVTEPPALPALPDMGGGMVNVDTTGQELSPFVMFFDRRSTQSLRIQSAIRSVQDGDPVLVYPEPDKPEPLPTFRFGLFAAQGYFADVDSIGNILKARYETGHFGADGKALREHIDSIIFVHLADKVVPARCTWKTTKCLAVKKAVQALKDAADPEWGGISAEHQASLVAPYPWARFTCTVSTTKRTSRTSGYAYVAADCLVSPTGVGDWKRIGDGLGNEDWMKSMAACIEGYKRRLAEVEAAVKKG